MNEFSAFDRMIIEATKNMRTAYLGKVKKINGNTAMVQPLLQYTTGQPKTVNAVIPRNVKSKVETVKYMETNTRNKEKNFLVPDSLAIGDIVYVGICDRDITTAKNGTISKPTRHHNINDGVILRVL